VAEACPRCGAPDVAAATCPQCGVVIAVYRASLDTLRRGPAARPAPSALRPAAPRVGFAPPVAAAPARAAVAAPPASRRLVFHGSAPGLFGIQAVNALLTLLTAGVFFFWGKTRVRRYTLSETELDGDRFAYHGTGRELLVGFAKGVSVFFIPVALLAILPELYEAPGDVRSSLRSLLWLVGVLLVPVAMVGARRYRLSRMSWRGIRFSFRGRVRDFVGVFVVGTILTSLTLGFYYPVFVTQKQAFMVSHAYFGSRKFDFDGRGRDLVRPFLVMILLFVPTLGLAWFWFSARRQRYFLEHTRFGLTRLRSAVTGGRLAWLQITNVLAIVLTLGFLWPWTVVRSLRFTFRYVTLQGPLDVTDVHQDARPASAMGEGLASLLDADFGVG
jgi:uncharacterized membrane protein YjgN (DUF898 family)